jgi:hypothetical protein
MAQNYNQSTRERIRDIKHGMLVETNILLGTAYLATAQVELFTVYNRIIVLGLWFEVTTLWAGATTLFFTWTSPITGLTAISTVSGSMATFVAGHRNHLVGDAVGTATNTEESAAVTMNVISPMMLGSCPTVAGVRSEGTIGQDTGAAGTGVSAGKFGLLYAPVDAGSLAVALL